MAGLTLKQVEQYRRDGFLFPLRAFSANDARALRDTVETIEAEYATRHCPKRARA